MIVSYEDGKMIVTHPTGVVDNYIIEQLEVIRDNELAHLADCQANCDCINDYIANAEASSGEKVPIS